MIIERVLSMEKEKVKYNKIPDIVGKYEDDARDYLSKKKIKVRKKSIKKFNLNYKSGTVIKVDPPEGTKIPENKIVKIYVAENRLFTIFLALIVFLLGIIGYFGYKLSYVMLNVDGPFIKSEYQGYTTNNIVRVVTKSGLENFTNYQYCMTLADNTNNCVWTNFEGTEFTIGASGKWNVYVRAYDKNTKKYSLKSNKLEILIDKEQPIIKNVTFVKNKNNIKFEIEAIDSLSGIKSYSYSLDGYVFTETNEEFTLSNVFVDKIYIKVIDQLNNEIIKEVSI
jgi:hypothetical protein